MLAGTSYPHLTHHKLHTYLISGKAREIAACANLIPWETKMICPQCQHANSPGTSVCFNCGFNSQFGHGSPSTPSVFWKPLIAVISMISILGMLILVAMPPLIRDYIRACSEIGPVESLRSLHNSQAHYQ